jgi:hypothetical protein
LTQVNDGSVGADYKNHCSKWQELQRAAVAGANMHFCDKRLRDKDFSFVGLDVHKSKNAIALAGTSHRCEARFLIAIENSLTATRGSVDRKIKN